MSQRKWITVFVVGVLLAAACPGIFAQYNDMWGTKWNNPVSSFIGASPEEKRFTETGLVFVR